MNKTKIAKRLINGAAAVLTLISLTGCAKKQAAPKPNTVNKTVAKTAGISVNAKPIINNNLHYNNYVKSYSITSYRKLGKRTSNTKFILGNTPMQLEAYNNLKDKASMYAGEGAIYIKAKRSDGKNIWVRQDSEKRANQLITQNAKSANQYMNTFANPILADIAKAETTQSGFKIYIKDTKENRRQIQTQYSQGKKGLKIKHYEIELYTDKKGRLIKFRQLMEYNYKRSDNRQTIIINKPNKYNNLTIPKSVTKHAVDAKKIRMRAR